MIYFGWGGWGPWHTWDGSIWFLTGFVLFPALALSVPWRSKIRFDMGRSTLAMYLLLFFVIGSLIGGYYSWFSAVRAQTESLKKYCPQLESVEFQ